MMRSARSLRVRLCPSWPGLAPPGFDFSRCSLRSVEGGFEDVREVFSGRCRRSTKSISSSLLRRSSSLRPIPPFNQSKQRDARAWVIAHTPVYPREVVKRALELSASALILVHKHPSGDPTPSAADVKMTRDVVDIAKPLGIAVHDHIIVGREGHASLKGLRLI